MAIRIDIEHIDPSDTGGEATVIRVAGRLAGDAVTHLTQVCKPTDGSIVLDLSKLMFADDAGVKVIRMLGKNGAEISGASAFISLLIDDETGY
jgi:anti-anti-sigma regulatory factor